MTSERQVLILKSRSAGKSQGLAALAEQKIERKLVAQRPRRNWREIRWAPPGGGLAERERRRQQIARGVLTESNGLLRSAAPE